MVTNLALTMRVHPCYALRYAETWVGTFTLIIVVRLAQINVTMKERNTYRNPCTQIQNDQKIG